MLKRNIDLSEDNLQIFKALASDIRLKILKIIRKEPRNMQDLANLLNISPPALTSHIKKLIKAKLIKIEKSPGQHGTQKLCLLNTEELTIKLIAEKIDNHSLISIPIGHYTDIKVEPTCGLASETNIIGSFDQPEFFADPERIKAGILWLATGYVEYTIPKQKNKKIKGIEISLELGSEAKGANNDWPSDLFFYLNNVKIGFWTSPGDFANRKGRLNPDWWGKGINQYGLLKRIKINNKGSFIDNEYLSDIKLNDLNLNKENSIKFKIETPKNTKNPGGLTIYGKTFGDYEQDICIRFLS